MVRTALVTVEDRRAASPTDDAVVKGVRALLSTGPFVEVDYVAVPDEQAVLRKELRILADGAGVDLVLTLGGIGPGVRERTPEATQSVLERDLPGLAVRMRTAAAEHDPRALLTRGVAGVRRHTLVLNLPGDEGGARAALAAVLEVLPAAVEALGPHTGAAEAT